MDLPTGALRCVLVIPRDHSRVLVDQAGRTWVDEGAGRIEPVQAVYSYLEYNASLTNRHPRVIAIRVRPRL